MRLLSITKLQNLKAIHNSPLWQSEWLPVVINHKTTKFESNSQHHFVYFIALCCCYQSQNYKIWKQFTTECAIIAIVRIVVINHKTTKFESNSQHKQLLSFEKGSCYQSQNYKIWKQFTTLVEVFAGCFSLLSITKLQNLKAIHNDNAQKASG